MWRFVFPAGEGIQLGRECVRCGAPATAALPMEASVGFELPVVLGTLRRHADVDGPACARCERWYRRARKPAAVVAGLATVAAVFAAVVWLPNHPQNFVWYGLVVFGSAGVFWGSLARALFDLAFCRTCVLLSPLDGSSHVVTFSPLVRGVLGPQVAALKRVHALGERSTELDIQGFGCSVRPKPPFEAWLEWDGRALALLRRTPKRTLGFQLEIVHGRRDIRPIAAPSMVHEVAILEGADETGPWRVICDEYTARWEQGWRVRSAPPGSPADHEWLAPEGDAPLFVVVTDEGDISIRTHDGPADGPAAEALRERVEPIQDRD